ncbi:MAG: hypothetical protein H7301_00855 [Cryobacterium sp.]|nr:hypothetical protein [Oligoflexia bacterium]
MKMIKIAYALPTLLPIALLIPFSSAFAAPSSAVSRGHSFGAGIVIGEPTALSAKLWLAPDKAVDFGLAFSFDEYALVYSDYLLHYPGSLGHSTAFISELSPYFGVGLVLAFANDKHYDRDRRFFGRGHDSLGAGVRVPLGIEWIPARTPLGVFVELVPGISIVPETSGLLEGGIGIRYYF